MSTRGCLPKGTIDQALEHWKAQVGSMICLVFISLGKCCFSYRILFLSTAWTSKESLGWLKQVKQREMIFHFVSYLVTYFLPISSQFYGWICNWINCVKLELALPIVFALIADLLNWNQNCWTRIGTDTCFIFYKITKRYCQLKDKQ